MGTACFVFGIFSQLLSWQHKSQSGFPLWLLCFYLWIVKSCTCSTMKGDFAQ